MYKSTTTKIHQRPATISKSKRGLNITKPDSNADTGSQSKELGERHLRTAQMTMRLRFTVTTWPARSEPPPPARGARGA